MNKQNFREQDIESAIKEHNCIESLDLQKAILIDHQEYAEARKLLVEIDRSLRELEKFKRSKEEYDRFMEVIKKMNEIGIPAKAVKRCVR